jgi:N-glycosylase/DNA lyase
MESLVRYSPYSVESAVQAVLAEIDSGPAQDWTALTEEALWMELVACLLSSRVRHDVSSAAVMHLQLKGLLRPPYSFDDLLALKVSFIRCLRRVDGSNNYSAASRKYPFARQRAEYLVATIKNIYRGCSGLKTLISDSNNTMDLRMELIGRCMGIGPKQASLFLTNVGVASDLAIIDIHVTRYLCVLGLARGDENPSRMSDYLVLEERLRNYAASFSCTLATLDTAIWVVMRTISSIG